MNIKGLDIEKIGELLMGVVGGEENLSDAKVRALLVAAYTELTKQYAPLIRAVPAVAGPLAKDVAPVVCTLLDLCSNIAGTAPFKASHKKFAQARAATRMTSLNAYIDAGFSRQEAFQLVLQDASHKLQTQNIPLSSSKS